VNFSVRNDRDISAALQELHDLLPFPRYFRPPGFGIRILFQSAQVPIFEAKIDLF
jgi:hypothetical protein